MIYSIAFTVSIISLLGAFVSAQFSSPFPKIIGKADYISGSLFVVSVVSFVTGIIALIWGV